ncbi:MAG: ABC transporter ATP-binding protein [Candidatus Peregrinibacteria bacterium]|nr:ABC transporter ATP-binding protein [Candidatus Peregrinibacteria bacterium]
MNAVEIKNLTKVYKSGTVALKGIDLTIEHGDFYGLLGANGAGKTTTIGIMTSLVNKTGGTVEIYGNDIDKDFSAAKRAVGVVPQEFNFNIFEKVIDIVVTQAGYFGMPRKEALKRATPILKQLSLWEKKDQPSRTLSGGMKRRLMIARALIHDPKLLILDEPTSGVDVELRYGMWDYLKELNKGGTSILLTTHYLEEAEHLCRNLAIIKEGEIVKRGSVKKLIASVENQRYIVSTNHIEDNFKLEGFDFEQLDSRDLSVTLHPGQSVTSFVAALEKKGVTVKDLRPTMNRLEQLFLDILKK